VVLNQHSDSTIPDKYHLKTITPIDIHIKICYILHENIYHIFGPKVSGFPDEESDIDLLILLPCEVTKEMKRQIIHKVFHINLQLETNISPFILSRKEWKDSPIPLLPIHHFIEEEGVSV